MTCRWLNIWNLRSPRCAFQWKYLLQAEVPVLNLGSGEDDLGFGDYAVHLDLLPFPRLQSFVQADAYHIPFADESFDTVIMGDIVEHLERPWEAIEEAARVTKYRLVMSIFHESRLPRGYTPPRVKWSGHCWNFDDGMIDRLTDIGGWQRIEARYQPEVVHEGQQFYNWLIAAERKVH